MLRLLNRDATLRNGDDHRACNDEDKSCDQQQQTDRRQDGVALDRPTEVLIDPIDGIWHSREDARNENDRDAVADSVLVDLLAKPHEEQATCGKTSNTRDVEDRKTTRSAFHSWLHEPLRTDVAQPHHALHDAQRNGHIARVLVDLGLA